MDVPTGYKEVFLGLSTICRSPGSSGRCPPCKRRQVAFYCNDMQRSPRVLATPPGHNLDTDLIGEGLLGDPSVLPALRPPSFLTHMWPTTRSMPSVGSLHHWEDMLGTEQSSLVAALCFQLKAFNLPSRALKTLKWILFLWELSAGVPQQGKEKGGTFWSRNVTF